MFRNCRHRYYWNMNRRGGVFIIYCYTTNYHMFSGLKQYSLMAQFLWLRSLNDKGSCLPPHMEAQTGRELFPTSPKLLGGCRTCGCRAEVSISCCGLLTSLEATPRTPSCISTSAMGKLPFAHLSFRLNLSDFFLHPAGEIFLPLQDLCG
jgi:hypothetical protein